MVVEKTEYRGIVNPVPSIPEAEQRELIAKYEPTEVYDYGSGATPDDVLKQQRAPKAVVVSDAALVIEQIGSKEARYEGFLWFKTDLHRKGGFFIEARTGLRSDKKADWAIIRPNAKKMLGRFAQGWKSAFNAKRGAKPWPPPEVTLEIRQAMKDEWYTVASKRTSDQATAAIKRKFKKLAPKRTILYREFGPPVIKRK